MGDAADALVDDWRCAREERQERHARWFNENMAVLRASGLPFAIRTTAVLFRIAGKPKVDFFPHTGRWRHVKLGGRTYGGGARKFLEWFANQKEPTDG